MLLSGDLNIYDIFRKSFRLFSENMDDNLQHEDLLIKLRAKLNDNKIKLWEPPYYDTEVEITTELQVLFLFNFFYFFFLYVLLS